MAADPICPIYPVHLVCTSQCISRASLAAQCSVLSAHPPDPRRSACIPRRLSPGLGRRRLSVVRVREQHTSCGEFIYPQPACPAVVATKHLAQYESPGCPCCCSAHLLLLLAHGTRVGPERKGARGKEQGARRQWSSGQWSNEHQRLHAKYSSRRANRGSVALCSYVALPIVSTKPSLSVPNRPSWSPPIFSGYYFESKRKYSVLCCTVRTFVPKSSALLVAQRITAGEDAARDRRPGSSRRECQVMPTFGVACSGQGLRAPP